MFKTLLYFCFTILSLREARARIPEMINGVKMLEPKLVSATQGDDHIVKKKESISLINRQPKPVEQRAGFNCDVAYLGLAMLLIIAVVICYCYRNKRRSNFELQFQQMEITKQYRQLQGLIVEKDRLINEKDWLLQEIHHRVKNNLQLVTSLLSTQAAYLKDKVAFQAISDSNNRVQAISLIHQKLYSTGRISAIATDIYINDLVHYLSDSFSTLKKGIRFEQHIEPLELEIRQAIAVGLILNETITNSVKYAFEGNEGKIIISLRLMNDNQVLLTLADSGKGFGKEFDIEKASTLGMEMIKALCKQLDGNIRVENNSGAAISIIFNLETAADGPAANELLM